MACHCWRMTIALPLTPRCARVSIVFETNERFPMHSNREGSFQFSAFSRRPHFVHRFIHEQHGLHRTRESENLILPKNNF